MRRGGGGVQIIAPSKLGGATEKIRQLIGKSGFQIVPSVIFKEKWDARFKLFEAVVILFLKTPQNVPFP